MSKNAAEHMPKRLHWRIPNFNIRCVDKGTTAWLMVLELVSAGAGFHRWLRKKPFARSGPRAGNYVKDFSLTLKPPT
ncbi:MAG TPA: hypothetical protein VGR47_03235 [Terracidiphilus sp.]|nr:hypothetical protein [Terracidiphilus sp.]